MWPFIVDQDSMQGNFLFGAVKLTTNADLDKYKYSSNCVGFDASGSFLLCDGSGFGKHVV